MQQDIDEIKDVLKKIEKKKGTNPWLQFFMFPLILAGMGYYFQSIIKESENRIEELKMTQTIVNDIYKDTVYERTVAMRGIMSELLQNDELSKKLNVLIDERVKKLILEGTPKEVSGIVNAVENVSNESDSLKLKLEASEEIQTVLKTRTNLASAKEREGFNYLASGNLVAAEKAFRQVDSIYPTYHQAYEIYRYLDKVNKRQSSERNLREIQKFTIENYNYGAPKDIVERIKTQNNIQ